MKIKFPKITAPIALFVFAPALGELLTGSTPPLQFLNPLIWCLLALLYGCGAILAREINVRWGGGALSLLFLGMGYGIVEEGLAVGSFFDPAWHDLGWMQGFGRSYGTNWPWTVHLTIHHAVYSIFLSVLIAELLYPAQRAKAWLTTKAMWINALGLFTVLALSRTFFYRISPAQALACLIGIGIFCFLAYRFRQVSGKPWQSGERPVGWLVFATVTSYFLIAFGAIKALSPIGAIALLLILGYLIIQMMMKVSAANSRKLEINLVTGMASFWIILAILAHVKPGMPIVGVLTLVGVIALRRDDAKNSPQPGALAK